MKKLYSLLAAVLGFIAIAVASTASVFSIYQPRVPKSLR
ncbi:MAG: cyclic lactone autoinducer peptide [Acetivibrionales bacterium]|jgi:cyclic lactone autoinducer peptide